MITLLSNALGWERDSLASMSMGTAMDSSSLGEARMVASIFCLLAGEWGGVVAGKLGVSGDMVENEKIPQNNIFI